jgi:hypothetical protein
MDEDGIGFLVFKIILAFLAVYFSWAIVFWTWSPFNNFFEHIGQLTISERCLAGIYLSLSCNAWSTSK